MGHVLFSHQVSGVSRINRDITAKVRRIGLLLLIASHLHRESLCSLLGKSPSFQRKHSREFLPAFSKETVSITKIKKKRDQTQEDVLPRDDISAKKILPKPAKPPKLPKKIYIYIMGKING